MVHIVWHRLPKKTFSLGMGHAIQLKQNLQKPFLKNIHQNWAEFCKEVKIESVNQVLNFPVWYNQNLLNGFDICIQDWFDKRIIHVSDLIDEEGNLYHFEALETKRNLRGTYLDFLAFTRRLPDYWKNQINDNILTCILSKHYVRCNVYVQCF